MAPAASVTDAASATLTAWQCIRQTVAEALVDREEAVSEAKRLQREVDALQRELALTKAAHESARRQALAAQDHHLQEQQEKDAVMGKIKLEHKAVLQQRSKTLNELKRELELAAAREAQYELDNENLKLEIKTLTLQRQAEVLRAKDAQQKVDQLEMLLQEAKSDLVQYAEDHRCLQAAFTKLEQNATMEQKKFAAQADHVKQLQSEIKEIRLRQAGAQVVNQQPEHNATPPAVKQTIEQLMTERTQLQDSIQLLLSELSVTKKELDTAKVASLQRAEKLAHWTREHATEISERAQQQQQLQDLMHEQQSLQRTIQQLNQQLDQQQNLVAQLQQDLATAETELEKTQAHLRASETALEESRTAHAQASEKHQDLWQAHEFLKAQVKSQKDNLDTLQQERDELQNRAAKLADEVAVLEKIRVSLQELQQQHGTALKSLHAAEAKESSLQDEIHELHLQVAHCQEMRAEAVEKLKLEQERTKTARIHADQWRQKALKLTSKFADRSSTGSDIESIRATAKVATEGSTDPGTTTAADMGKSGPKLPPLPSRLSRRSPPSKRPNKHFGSSIPSTAAPSGAKNDGNFDWVDTGEAASRSKSSKNPRKKLILEKSRMLGARTAAVQRQQSALPTAKSTMLSARPPPNTADTGGVPMGLHGSKQQSAEDDKADHVSGAADESPRKPQTGTGAHEAGTDVAVSTSTPPLAPVTTPQKAPAPENASPVKDAGGDTPVPFMLDVREHNVIEKVQEFLPADYAKEGDAQFSFETYVRASELANAAAAASLHAGKDQ